jgi:hypothetical protein
MATPAPPFGGSAPPPDTSALPSPQQDTQPCPVCQGAGEVPASMGRDEMLQALDQNMPEPMEPGNSAPQAPPPFSLPGRQPMTDDQNAEVSRLGAHAKDHMSKRNFGY